MAAGLPTCGCRARPAVALLPGLAAVAVSSATASSRETPERGCAARECRKGTGREHPATSTCGHRPHHGRHEPHQRGHCEEGDEHEHEASENGQDAGAVVPEDVGAGQLECGRVDDGRGGFVEHERDDPPDAPLEPGLPHLRVRRGCGDREDANEHDKHPAASHHEHDLERRGQDRDEAENDDEDGRECAPGRVVREGEERRDVLPEARTAFGVHPCGAVRRRVQHPHGELVGCTDQDADHGCSERGDRDERDEALHKIAPGLSALLPSHADAADDHRQHGDGSKNPPQRGLDEERSTADPLRASAAHELSHESACRADEHDAAEDESELPDRHEALTGAHAGCDLHGQEDRRDDGEDETEPGHPAEQHFYLCADRRCTHDGLVTAIGQVRRTDVDPDGAEGSDHLADALRNGVGQVFNSPARESFCPGRNLARGGNRVPTGAVVCWVHELGAPGDVPRQVRDGRHVDGCVWIGHAELPVTGFPHQVVDR
ncbi:hypothetical protein ACFPRL_34145 [Pseudoclavibacter helvolus]